MAQVTYRVDFEGTWSAATHPGAFASNSPHFTRLVGGIHSDAVSFWEAGGLATPGIESMAELGGTGTLLGEVQTAINAGTARSTLLGDDLFNLPNSTSLTITVDEAYPLVTLVTMIAPSSDWFVGVSGLSLRENDQWLGQVVVDLYAYDAGTEEGSGFSLSNPATSPHEAISLLGAPFAGLPSLGTFTFTVQPNELVGDFNLDGEVDGADAGVWEAGFGGFSDGSAFVVDGDANEDGQVNGSDFLLWQRNFGQSLLETSVGVSVPESESLVLLMVGLVVVLVANPGRRQPAILRSV